MRALKSHSPTDLKVWEKIRLVVGEGVDAGVYEARVEDLINGGILISSPQFLSGHTLLRQGVTVIVQFIRDDAAYEFDSDIRQRPASGAKRVILTPPKRIRRVQRRMFARVEMSAVVTCSTLETSYDWSAWREKLPWQRTHLKDISAGGLAMNYSESCQADALFVLSLNFFEEIGLPKYLIAKSVRVFTIDKQRYCSLHYLLSDTFGNTMPRDLLAVLPTEFTQFDRHAQDKLADYLFKKQVEQRQKGLI